jgi:hypothetical protein
MSLLELVNIAVGEVSQLLLNAVLQVAGARRQVGKVLAVRYAIDMPRRRPCQVHAMQGSGAADIEQVHITGPAFKTVPWRRTECGAVQLKAPVRHDVPCQPGRDSQSGRSR